VINADGETSLAGEVKIDQSLLALLKNTSFS